VFIYLCLNINLTASLHPVIVSHCVCVFDMRFVYIPSGLVDMFLTSEVATLTVAGDLYLRNRVFKFI